MKTKEGKLIVLPSLDHEQLLLDIFGTTTLKQYDDVDDKERSNWLKIITAKPLVKEWSGKIGNKGIVVKSFNDTKMYRGEVYLMPDSMVEAEYQANAGRYEEFADALSFAKTKIKGGVEGGITVGPSTAYSIMVKGDTDFLKAFGVDDATLKRYSEILFFGFSNIFEDVEMSNNMIDIPKTLRKHINEIPETMINDADSIL